VGLRSNDPELVDVLRRVLAPIRVDGLDVFPNLSLYRGAEGRTRELHRLSRHGATVLRTTSTGRLVRAALHHLDGFLPPPPGLLPFRADLLLGPRGAALVHDAGTQLNVSERRLARLGWQRTDGVPLIDLETLEVVVPEPRLALDAEVVAEIDARWPVGPEERGLGAGRHPVHAVVLLGSIPDHVKIASPARRLASFASLIDTLGGSVKAAELESLGRLEHRCEVVRALGFEPSELLGILEELAR